MVFMLEPVTNVGDLIAFETLINFTRTGSGGYEINKQGIGTLDW